MHFSFTITCSLALYLVRLQNMIHVISILPTSLTCALLRNNLDPVTQLPPFPFPVSPQILIRYHFLSPEYHQQWP